jgi:acyl-CoA reductase-like NAD-dependent aldehyde dehydrogenase
MDAMSQATINLVARSPVPTTSITIGGTLGQALSGRTRPVVSPIDGSHLADIPDCDAADVDRAVAAARKAFAARHWQGMTPRQRKRIMLRWADLIEGERLNLAVLETRDQGQTVQHAWDLDIGFAIDTLRWYAEAADKIYDELAVLEDPVTAMIVRAPLGVVGAILPWNAPAMIAAWKLGPALVTGNSVILKPSEHASLVCLRLGELALQAGFPEGVVQVVTGDGRVGAAMAGHGDIDCLTFTGSGNTGRSILAASARTNLKRVSLELGGKSANIVMADAPDLDVAAETSVNFMFSNQGQVCEAPSRMLVQRQVYDRMLAEVVARTRVLSVGNPLQLDTRLGPIVTEAQRTAIRAHIDRAVAEGARLALDGRRAPVPEKGYYIGPTVAVDLAPGSALAREEVFGPVLAVFAFDTLDEAIDMANDSRYGLGASLWSASIDTIMYATRRLIAGNINVNGGTGPVVELPYGGFKESGFGRDRSLHAIDKYSDLKNIIIRTAR